MPHHFALTKLLVLPGAYTSLHAAPLTGVITNVAITARCTLNNGQSFPAGNYSATLAASLTGTSLLTTAAGTAAVNCNATGCSTLQICGSTGPPKVEFALQCPRLPSQVALGDSLVLVFPVAATGNVAATSLTLTDVLGAGLYFVSALVDYGEHLPATLIDVKVDRSQRQTACWK
jgi:uncharacterized repeat protein (TIGR01451 family)